MAARLTVRQRRWLLSAHVLAVAACLGGVLCSLALRVVAAGGSDLGVRGAALVAAELVDVQLIRPAAIASLVTGVLLAALGPWGLVRHYWVILKTVLTIALIAIGIVVVRLPLQQGAEAALRQGLGVVDAAATTGQPALLVGLGLQIVALATMVVVSVFKPWGQRGRARRRTVATAAAPTGEPVATLDGRWFR